MIKEISEITTVLKIYKCDEKIDETLTEIINDIQFLTEHKEQVTSCGVG